MENKTPFNLEEQIEIWLQQYGVEATANNRHAASYFRIEVKYRFELLKVLVKKLRALGKEKEYFNTTTKDKIVEAIIPVKGSVPTQTYNGFKLGAHKHLNSAITAVFSEEEIAVREDVSIPKTTETEKEPEREIFVPKPVKEEKDYIFDDDLSDILGLK